MAPRRSARVSAAQQEAQVEAHPTQSSPRKKSKKSSAVLGNGTTMVQKNSKAKTKSESAFKVPEAPTTPKRNRATNDVRPPPITPTPSMVGLMSAPYSTGDIDDATPPPQSRPVEPHRAAATLVTPGGTQVVAYNDEEQDLSPSKRLPRPTATTGSLLKEACDHLIKVDPRLKPVIDKFHCRIFAPEGLAEEIDPFRSLVSGIMGQQVSGAAAKSIKNKFIALFNEDSAKGLEPPKAGEVTSPTLRFPTPAQVVKADIPHLRTAGLSEKAEYIKGLAEKFVSGELSTQMLLKAGDDEVMEKLIAVRGLGKWSVEMFACFGLKRMDVFSTGDLGVQRGMAAFVGKDVAKLKAKGGGKWKYMSEQDMLDLSAKFAPYRSLFMWYMWRIEDVDVEAMESNSSL